MRKHTPGPWIAGKFALVGDGDLRADCGVYHMNGGVAYSVCRCPAYQDQRQWESDSRLITAAPELLDALRAIYDYHNAETMAQARAAIAKATGE